MRFDGVTFYLFERTHGISSVPTHGGAVLGRCFVRSLSTSLCHRAGMSRVHHSVRHVPLNSWTRASAMKRRAMFESE